MSGLIYITDENGKLLEVIVTTLQGEDDERLQKVVTAPQAGIIGKFEPIMDAAGTVTGYNPTHGSSEANWSYNSWRIWEEIGWSPWHLFYKMETVVITEELIIDLLMQIEKVQKLPDQDQSRGEIEVALGH